MTPAERALLQERVKTLILGHALDLILARFVETGEQASRETAAELSRMEGSLLAVARGLADRAATQKLSVLVAVEDVSTSLKAAFDAARTRLDPMGSADVADTSGAMAA